ncbi:MAG: hypothetical protein LV479_06105 [Methylacidiphilales bacterium]|nr:hypothetical protein [Candidatus Methylacidiphilales bacterium]
MNDRKRLLFLSALLFLALAAGGPMVIAADGDANGGGDPAIKKNFNAAARVKMGTYQDMREITAAIKRDDANMTVIEIRWLTPNDVVVQAAWRKESSPAGIYYYTLRNENTGWRITERYLDHIS